MNAPNCPDCNVPMEQGYIPEKGHFDALTVSEWYPGSPKFRSGLFGKGLDVVLGRSLAIESFRCTQCGLLREYARNKANV